MSALKHLSPSFTRGTQLSILFKVCKFLKGTLPYHYLFELLKVIHGLDELVYYYQYQLNSGLQHRLEQHVPGAECPSAVR